MCNKAKWTPHAKERCKERNITKSKIDIIVVKSFPIYTTENGCTKYLDLENNILYFVRHNTIVTVVATNPIQMLRYYAHGADIKFNTLCRDNAFNNCSRGSKCKYIHV